MNIEYVEEKINSVKELLRLFKDCIDDFEEDIKLLENLIRKRIIT